MLIVKQDDENCPKRFGRFKQLRRKVFRIIKINIQNNDFVPSFLLSDENINIVGEEDAISTVYLVNLAYCNHVVSYLLTNGKRRLYKPFGRSEHNKKCVTVAVIPQNFMSPPKNTGIEYPELLLP